MAVQSKSLHYLVGTSKSGKTYLLRHMLRGMLRNGQLKFGLVFTATKFNGSFDWLPDKYVYANFDMDILTAWMQFLVRIKRSGKPIPDTFIVFDDIIAMLPLGTKPWSQFMSTFRQYNITLFITAQHITMADPLIRSQTEFAYLFQMHSDTQFESTFRTFGTLHRNKKAWRDFVTKYTGNYKCIVWSKESKSEMAERYKEFKAPVETKSDKEVKFEY